jgi:hypothetical protein
MPGLVPGIHAFLAARIQEGLDGRDKPGHDGGEASAFLAPHPEEARSAVSKSLPSGLTRGMKARACMVPPAEALAQAGRDARCAGSSP